MKPEESPREEKRDDTKVKTRYQSESALFFAGGEKKSVSLWINIFCVRIYKFKKKGVLSVPSDTLKTVLKNKTKIEAKPRMWGKMLLSAEM